MCDFSLLLLFFLSSLLNTVEILEYIYLHLTDKPFVGCREKKERDGDKRMCRDEVRALGVSCWLFYLFIFIFKCTLYKDMSYIKGKEKINKKSMLVISCAQGPSMQI